MQKTAFVLTLLLAANWAVPAWAQQSSEEPMPLFRSESRLVQLHATITDAQGNPVSGVTRDAVKVFENGVQQQIRVFRQEDAPVSVGILIDNSASMREKRAKVEAAALQFVNGSNADDEVFIVNFNEESSLDVRMTDDREKLANGVKRIDAKGGTAMRDAVNRSMDYVRDQGTRDKKVLLVVTDGDDNSSLKTLDRLLARVHQSGVMIYVVGLLSDSDDREAARAQESITKITAASGGMAYFPRSVEEVSQLAERVAREIRNQYTITYVPTNPDFDNTFRMVRVAGPAGLNVRTRDGYVAAQEQQGVRRVSQLHRPQANN